jgi:SPP1 gp7 family putative phage head morphogenesis protein
MAPRKKTNTPATYKAGGKLSSADESFYQSPYYQDSYDFPYNPDSLCSGNNYNVYDEMRHDDQVKACLALKKDMVMGTGFRVTCADNPEIAIEIEDNFRNLNDMALELSFEETLRDVCSFFDYGFSLSEVIYALVEGKYKLDSIRVRPPHSFLFDLDTKGNVKRLVQNGPMGPKDMDSDKFLHFTYQSDFGNPYGLSDLKAAHQAWKIKKYFLKFYAQAGERFVSPLVVGKYDANLSGDEATRIYDVLKSIQNSTTLVVPKDAEIEFKQPEKDTLTQYDTAIKTLNLWISRAILVPDLLGLSGEQTAGGSYALGGTQFKMFMSTIGKVRDQIARKITARVIMPMVKANYGEGIECKFEFLPFNQADEMEYSKMWLDAVKAGVKPNEAQINTFLDIVRYPKFEEGEVAFEAPTPFGEQKPKGEQAKAPAEAKEDEGEEEEGEKPKVKEMSDKWPRPFTSFEKKCNFAEIKRTLNDFEAKLAPRIQKAAEKINASIVEQIKSRNLVTGFKPEQIERLKPKFMREMNFLYKKHFTDLFFAAAREAKAELVGQDNIGKYVDSEILPEEFIDIIEAESFNMVKDYASGVLKKAQAIVAEGIKRGVSQAEIVKQVMAANSSLAERHAVTMVRTKTTEVYNAARKTYWETDELAKDIVVAFQYSAIMDTRTTDICQSLDGKVFEKGEGIDRATPPLHFGCRSQLIPVTKFEDYKASKMPSVDTLQARGGNLVFKENMPALIVSNTIKEFGDKVVIAPAGENLSVSVKRISVANLSHIDPVVVGFREDDQVNLRYQREIGFSQPWDMSFDGGWILPAGKGLIINLSAPIEITFTIEYEILGPMGERIR